MSRDDWSKPRKTHIDWRSLIQRNPKHLHCPLKIATSPKNPLYTGLYCKTHGTWLAWVNEFQIYNLQEFNIDIPEQFRMTKEQYEQALLDDSK